MPLSLRLARLTTLAAALLLAACDDDPSGPTDAPVRGVVVLHGFGAQGISLLDTALTTRAFVAFDAGFDGGTFTVRRDTALATSSKGGGDKLYVTDLAERTLRTVQLPAESNPADAAFLPSQTGVSRFGVALRDSGAIAVVAVPQGAGAATVTLLHGAGRCPSAIVPIGSDIWSVDVNANCATDYEVVGPVRLIRLAANGGRDTIPLPTLARGTGVSTALHDGILHVATSGVVTFAGVVTTPPSITRVNLATRAVLSNTVLAPGFWGAALRVGLDDLFYVTSYDVAAGYRTRTFAIDPDRSQFTGPTAAGQNYLELRRPDGQAAQCAAVDADAAGQIYCAENGTAFATTVHVFARDGRFVRSLAGGQGAVDLVLRR